MDRLPILKALGDNTRYAIYLEVARSAAPRSTSEIAETLGLHPNTVRPHLERMREVGLLDVEVISRGQVGRPQHRYMLSSDAPSLGLEPPAFPLLARMLGALAATFRPAAEEVAAVARREGREAGHNPRNSGQHCVPALIRELEALGFDPASVVDGKGRATIAFTHCPYRDLAEEHPELVCNLHRGLIEGFLAERGQVKMRRFSTLADQPPCQVALAPL